MSVQFSMDERFAYLKRYGKSAVSFLTLQPGMSYFDVPGMGYVSYKSKWGHNYVLSDPVCDPADAEVVIRAYLDAYPRSSFAEVYEPVAELLYNKFGYYTSQMGVETIVDLEGWDMNGKKKQILRTAYNQSISRGIHIYESNDETRYRDITPVWLKSKKVKKREITYLVRPLDMGYTADTRKFFARLDDTVIGFVFFDPLYWNNRVVGYVSNISRYDQTFRQGIYYSIMAHALQRFKQEGVESINLGLSPYLINGDCRYHESRGCRKMLDLAHRNGNFLFSFKGLEFTKSRFCGRETRVYVGHRAYVPALIMLPVFKITNIL